MNEKMKKILLGGIAGLVALSLVISIGAQFGDSSLKATDEDQEAVEAAQEESQEHVVQVVELPLVEPAPAAEPAEQEQAAAPVEESVQEPAPEPAPAPAPEEQAPAAEPAEQEQAAAPAEESAQEPAAEQTTEEKPEEAEKAENTEDGEAAETAEEGDEAEETEETEATEETEEPEEEVTITYSASEGGTVSAASENVAAESGEAKGATAAAKEGWHFVCWTKNGAVVGTAETFVPAKVGGKYEAAAYVANFEEDEEELGVSVVFYSEDGEYYYGSNVVMTAVVTGGEGKILTYQWQYSKNNASWSDIPGATGASTRITITEENARNFWRVVVDKQ